MTGPHVGPRSQALFERAVTHIPGGVNSPVRAWKAVGGSPPFLRRGSGCRVEDEDGRSYIDYVLSWGPLILGHAHPGVVEAVCRAARDGVGFGAATEAEVRLAERLTRTVPGLDVVRLVTSGTEACMSAIRLARAATGRDLILKFDGCYHGHSDSLLVAAGSGAETLGVPDSPGVPAALAALTLVVPYNDVEALDRVFAEHGGRIAAAIVEPVAGNLGLAPPKPDFLPTLRTLTRAHGALLILDEVMTGFRAGPKGAGARYGIEPDLLCLGKVIGGGLPLAAYGGRADLMVMVAPRGPVYQAGTLAGNPVAVAAGEATLIGLAEDGVWDGLERAAARLEAGITGAIRRAGGGARVQRVGAMFGVHFRDQPVWSLEDARACDTARFVRVFHGLLARGVYVAPSAFEAAFLSTAHDDAAIDETVQAWTAALAGA
jgi:glutamate-1-semialdehyde 2,1-aminomutase